MANTFLGIPLLADWHAGYGLSESGGLISAWTDCTSNAWSVSQDTAILQPTYSTDHGRASVYFDASNAEILQRSQGLGLTGNPALTIITACYRLDTTTRGLIVFGSVPFINGNYIGLLSDYSIRHGNGSKIYATAVPAAWEVAVLARNSGDNYGQQDFWLNGTKRTTTSTGGSQIQTPNITDLFSIGGGSARSYLSRVLIFSTKLSDTQIVNVAKLLKQNWAWLEGDHLPRAISWPSYSLYGD